MQNKLPSFFQLGVHVLFFTVTLLNRLGSLPLSLAITDMAVNCRGDVCDDPGNFVSGLS